MYTDHLDALKRADAIYNYKLHSLKNLRTFSKYAWKSALNVSKNYGGSLFCVWLDMMWCNLRYGVTHDMDYTLFEFYRKSARERNSFITNRRFYKLIKKFDKDTFYPMVDKSLNYKKYAIFIKREWLLVNADTTPQELTAFIEKHGTIIVKPLSADSGNGVYKISVSEQDKIAKLLDDKSSHNYLAEEICENCEELKAINPSSLNTLRLVTLVEKDLNIKIIGAQLRCGCGKSIADNWSAGGVGYPVDIATGYICGPGIDHHYQKHLIHPGTDIVMPGIKIPRFEEACELARRVIGSDKKVVFAGLDLAIMEDGVELIEVNFPPSRELVQAVDMIGKYPLVKNMYIPE